MTGAGRQSVVMIVTGSPGRCRARRRRARRDADLAPARVEDVRLVLRRVHPHPPRPDQSTSGDDQNRFSPTRSRSHRAVPVLDPLPERRRPRIRARNRLRRHLGAVLRGRGVERRVLLKRHEPVRHGSRSAARGRPRQGVWAVAMRPAVDAPTGSASRRTANATTALAGTRLTLSIRSCGGVSAVRPCFPWRSSPGAVAGVTAGRAGASWSRTLHGSRLRPVAASAPAASSAPTSAEMSTTSATAAPFAVDPAGGSGSRVAGRR